MFDQFLVNALSTAGHLDCDLLIYLEDTYRCETGMLAEEPILDIRDQAAVGEA